MNIQDGSTFWCEEGDHMAKGKGYIYNIKQISFKCYQEIFPKFNEEETK